LPYIWIKEKGRVVQSLRLGGEVVLGRDQDCTVALADRRASRRHAVIRPADGGFEVEDMESTNGTFVNGTKLERPRGIVVGDTIAIGETNILVRAEPYFDPEGPRIEETADGVMRTLALDAGSAMLLPRDRGAAYERLAALYRFAGGAGAARTVSALFQLMTAAAEEVLESDRVFPVLVEKDGFRPWRREGGKRGALAADLDNIPISSSIVQAAAKDLRPVVMSRRKGEKFRRRQSVVKLEISTALAVPLAVGKDALAVLYADRVGDAPEFSDEDVEWMAAVAGMASGPLFALRNEERLSSRVRSLEKMVAAEVEMVGESQEIAELRTLVEQAAAVDSHVLITGESGVGKELVAKLLHLKSPRSERALEVLNCAALPESLAESELFGHVKGAFTGAVADKPGRFELASGGTLFLDEIGELSPGLQVKLLRAIETGEIRRVGGTETLIADVRVIAATNRDLEAEVAAGRFRQDLFYRLDVLRINVPPLRERRGDIALLVKHYIERFAGTMGRQAPDFTPQALVLLSDYPWPGNVRELKNAVERLMVLTPGNVITEEDVRGALPLGGGGGDTPPVSLAEMEKRHILGVLRAVGGNKSRAAEILGISRVTLYAKLDEAQLPSGDAGEIKPVT